MCYRRRRTTNEGIMGGDATQAQYERAVADAFIDWFNRHHGSAYTYHERRAPRPDFVFRMGPAEMLVEVTGAYYDQKYAAMLWQAARGVAGAPDLWQGKEPDATLSDHIEHMIKKKSGIPYPCGTALVVWLGEPALTSAAEFEELVSQITVPSPCVFASIYVGGRFPVSSDGSPWGVRFWKLA
jgi:hypothetical protein